MTRLGQNLRNTVYDSEDDTEGPPHGASGARIETGCRRVEERIVERIGKVETDQKLKAQRTLPEREATRKEVEQKKAKIFVEGTPTPKKLLPEVGFEPGTPERNAKVVFIPETPTYESHPGSNRDDETSSNSSEIPDTPARGYRIWVEQSPAPTPTHLGATPKNRSPVSVNYIVETPENRRSGNISEESRSGLSSPQRYINTVPRKSVPRAPKTPKSPRVPKTGKKPADLPEKPEVLEEPEEISTMEKILGTLAQDLSDKLLKKSPKATKAK